MYGNRCTFQAFGFQMAFLSLREKVFPHVVVTEEEINWRKVSPPQQHITAVAAPGTRIVQT